jgi:threonine synthase
LKYISTRGGMPPAPFTDILLGGLAPDGGLAVPDHYPQVAPTELAGWRALGYRELAFEILSRFIDDIPPAHLRDILSRTYTAEAFGSDEITPVTTLEPGLHLLHLSNGPTLAFKDIAMQLLGSLFEYVLAQRGEELNILGATSGDTGSAAEYAMKGKRRVRVFMLSPEGKMSPFQTAQMYSLQDANIFNIAVRGVFDDCQDMVKAVSNDLAFKAKHRIGTVNSINWARLVAQVVYYFAGYFQATSRVHNLGPAAVPAEQRVSFAVPSGNFGNICAGHIARMMGLPIGQLILATNENDVLDEFFRTGVYRPRGTGHTYETSSPSMDISKASNFERFVFDLVGRNGAKVREFWSKVDTGGAFEIKGTDYWHDLSKFHFTSGKSAHQDRLRTIRELWEEYGVMVDTHTADGIKVGLEQRRPSLPLICLETALPAKFAETIVEALGREPERPEALLGIENLPQRCEVMGADVTTLKAYIAANVPQ